MNCQYLAEMWTRAQCAVSLGHPVGLTGDAMQRTRHDREIAEKIWQDRSLRQRSGHSNTPKAVPQRTTFGRALSTETLANRSACTASCSNFSLPRTVYLSTE